MPRKSILNDRQAVSDAIDKSSSIKEALAHLGLRAAGGNYAAFNRAAATHGLSIPQWDRSEQLKRLHAFTRLPDSAIFVVNSTYSNRTNIKKRLYQRGIPRACASCGIGEEWNGKPLVLTLEHINGVWNDNRIENLEILCPNCHSQTETFCGKNK